MHESLQESFYLDLSFGDVHFQNAAFASVAQVKVVDVFAMPQSGTGVSVEAVDPVFQTKMLDMLKQTGRHEARKPATQAHQAYTAWPASSLSSGVVVRVCYLPLPIVVLQPPCPLPTPTPCAALPYPRPEMVVGWYHSHPGFGCWLSGVDINTQQVSGAARAQSPSQPSYLRLSLLLSHATLPPPSLFLSHPSLSPSIQNRASKH